MESLPYLVDPVQLNTLRKIAEKTTPKRQLGGFFDFLSDKYRDNLAVIFTIIFFVILGLFLYFRRKNKLAQDKTQPINQFIQSVNNYLYNPNENYYYG